MSSNIRHTTEEALFNWVEVWGVWWQEKEDATEALNDFSKHTHLVNRAVIENQNAFVLRVRIHTWQLVDR